MLVKKGDPYPFENPAPVWFMWKPTFWHLAVPVPLKLALLTDVENTGAGLLGQASVEICTTVGGCRTGAVVPINGFQSGVNHFVCGGLLFQAC